MPENFSSGEESNIVFGL